MDISGGAVALNPHGAHIAPFSRQCARTPWCACACVCSCMPVRVRACVGLQCLRACYLYVKIYLSIDPSIYRSIYRSIDLSIYLDLHI